MNTHKVNRLRNTDIKTDNGELQRTTALERSVMNKNRIAFSTPKRVFAHVHLKLDLI